MNPFFAHSKGSSMKIIQLKPKLSDELIMRTDLIVSFFRNILLYSSVHFIENYGENISNVLNEACFLICT